MLSRRHFVGERYGLIAKIHEVMGRLKQFKVKVNLEKSEFLVKKISYLGHQVSERCLGQVESSVLPVEEERPVQVACGV